MDALVFRTLRRLVKTGSLTITTANGVARTFGDGAGLAVKVRFRTATAQRRVLLDPELRLGEAFVDGDLIIEQGTITQFVNGGRIPGHRGGVKAGHWRWGAADMARAPIQAV